MPMKPRRINVSSSNRPVGHLEMEALAVVGTAGRDLLVELDAEAGLGRGDHIAFLPAHLLLQDLGVEAAPILDALEDQKVRAAGAELDVGGALDRAAIEMRGDLRVMRLRH